MREQLFRAKRLHHRLHPFPPRHRGSPLGFQTLLYRTYTHLPRSRRLVAGCWC